MTEPIRFEADDWDRSYHRAPFPVRHDLAAHPLFKIERLVALARALPPSKVEWNPGDLDVVHDPSSTPSNGLSAADTIARIEGCNSWLVLKYIDSEPEYAALLADSLASVRDALAAQGRALLRPRAFLFVSSPGSMTPCHVDPESNFLLQIRGTKTMSTFPRSDREIADERFLERFASGGHRNLSVDASTLDRADSFELRPGQGLHVPLHTPHFVRNGPEVSVSFSVTFHTKETEQERSVLWMNHKLRRLGVRPRPVGESRAGDRVKNALYRGLRSVRRVARGRVSTPEVS